MWCAPLPSVSLGWLLNLWSGTGSVLILKQGLSQCLRHFLCAVRVGFALSKTAAVLGKVIWSLRTWSLFLLLLWTSPKPGIFLISVRLKIDCCFCRFRLSKIQKEPGAIGVMLSCRVSAVLSGKSEFEKLCRVRDAASKWGPAA